MEFILTPPIALLIYIPLVILLLLFGKKLAGPPTPNPMKTSTYGSGEEAPTHYAAPGYQPFFLIAFFFAILHLGTLVLGSGGFTLTAGAYMVGLIVALIALVLG